VSGMPQNREVAAVQDNPKRLHIRKDKTNPRRLAYLTLLLFATPPGWPLFTVGILLVLSGVILHGWAAGYLARAGYAEREKILTVRGPYRHNRNPYYVAQMTMDLGFFLLAGRPLLLLLYFPVIFSVYQRWVANEEIFLENEFGNDYRILKREVPRWKFQLRPAPARGSELTFQWATFRLNRELPRALSHLCLMLTFVTYFFLGNPFSQVSVLSRITVLTAIAVWLLLRDVYPLESVQKSVGWALLAVVCTTVAIIFLVYVPVWQPWKGTSAWISISAGGLLGLLVAFQIFPRWFGTLTRKTGKLFVSPICQLYGLGMALGLISCTRGGVWIAIMTAFIVWLLSTAGILKPLGR
jgi:Phospholipid methyltransferase